jgi:hypothetical protein
MKQVIEGKVYNTATAECVASAESSGSRRDFSYWEESLYRTKKGAWFTAGSGGPQTKFSRGAGSGSWTGGDGMEVLTESEALAWCERNGIDADIITSHFKIEEA